MVSEYRKEQFIDQYEHITKLQLLSDEELMQVKRKRTAFEVSIKSASEVKPFIDYIKFEIALLKKFKSMNFESDKDEKAIDRAISQHVVNLFRMALKRFQDRRKVWEHYIAFVKQKFPQLVTRIYENMLCFHRKVSDYIEAAEHEMIKQNYSTSMNFLLQGMGNNKDSCEELVVAHIQCSLKQGLHQGDMEKLAILLQASKFYLKFLKESTDVLMHCNLIQKIQKFNYSLSFQNDILTNIMKSFADRAEVWDLLAKRELGGLSYEPPTEKSLENAVVIAVKPDKLPFQICLRNTITIYEKSLESVGELQKQKMFSFFIETLLELDGTSNISGNALKVIRQMLGKTLMRGYKEEKLSVDHFIMFLELRLINMEKYESEIEEMLENGKKLYQNSMEFYELAIKYYIETKNFNKITETFNFAVENNEKNAVDLYKFLCSTYLSTEDKNKAITSMIQAINSNNKNVSEAFQPYYIEYHAQTDGIEKAREVFNKLLATKTLNSLSLEFFKTMIKVEESQEKRNQKLIANCYERAVEHFGKDNEEIWLDYIKYLWKQEKHAEADKLRSRAMEYLKGNLTNVNKFELKFTLIRNENGMEVN